MTNAKKILQAKIALEVELAEPLSYVLSTYMVTWARNEGSVSIFDRSGHQQMIENVLKRHYARVVSVMSGVTPDPETTIDKVALGPAHAARLNARAHNQAMHMIRGMDRDLATALIAMPPMPAKADAGVETKKDKWSVGLVSRFKETAKQAWRKVQSRLKAIANVETETVAEEYQIEWVKQKYANARIYKTWNNMGDERVRGNPAGMYANSPFDHWHVDGQEVPVDQPFEVSGEHLKHPGDTSLGASLGNVISCRCHASFSIVGPNGERIDIPLQTPALPARRTWHPGDRLGVETPVSPTESVTLNGRTRANVVMGDGRTFGVMQQVTPNSVVVRIGGRDVARATFNGPDVTSVTVAPGNEHLDVDGLIRRSVAGTHRFLTQRR